MAKSATVSDDLGVLCKQGSGVRVLAWNQRHYLKCMTEDESDFRYSDHDHWPDDWGGPGHDHEVRDDAWPLLGVCGQCGAFIYKRYPRDPWLTADVSAWTLMSGTVARRHHLGK